jgi:hypothetical protein
MDPLTQLLLVVWVVVALVATHQQPLSKTVDSLE